MLFTNGKPVEKKFAPTLHAPSISAIVAPERYDLAELSIKVPADNLSDDDERLIDLLRSGSYAGNRDDFNAGISKQVYLKALPELLKRTDWVESLIFLEGKGFPRKEISAYSFKGEPRYSNLL